MIRSPFLLIFLIHASHSFIYSSDNNGKKEDNPSFGSNPFFDNLGKIEDKNKLSSSPFLPPSPPTFMFPPFLLFTNEVRKQEDKRNGSIKKREDDLQHQAKPNNHVLTIFDSFQKSTEDERAKPRKQKMPHFSVKASTTTPKSVLTTPPAKISPIWPFEKTIIFVILNHHKKASKEGKPKPNIKKAAPTTIAPATFGKFNKGNKIEEIVHPNTPISSQNRPHSGSFTPKTEQDSVYEDWLEVQTHKEKAFKTEQDSAYEDWLDVQTHKQKGFRSKSFYCGCGLKFFSKKDLDSHFEMTHRKESLSFQPKRNNKQTDFFEDRLTSALYQRFLQKQNQRGSPFRPDQSDESPQPQLLGYPGEHYGPSQELEHHPLNIKDVHLPSVKFSIPPPDMDNTDFYLTSPQRQPRSPTIIEEQMNLDYPSAFENYLPFEEQYMDDIVLQDDLRAPPSQQFYKIPFQQKTSVKTVPIANDLFYEY